MAYTHPLRFNQTILENAKTYSLSPSLVASVINVESSFNENSKSNKNAVGLMQIKLSTANYLNDLKHKKHITEEEIFIPSTNIQYGCEYLRYLLSKFEDLNTVLAAYNAGETIVRKWLSSGVVSIDGKTLTYIPYEETRNYVEKINKNIKYYKKIFKM
jgi:soluble lytic murein transglycosylase